jgi:hypothetical protein
MQAESDINQMSFADAFPYLESGCGMRRASWVEEPHLKLVVDWDQQFSRLDTCVPGQYRLPCGPIPTSYLFAED